MPAARTGSTNTSTQPEQNLQEIVTALRDVAAAVAQNTAELQAAQRRGDFGGGGTGGGTGGGGERSASLDQSRTVLNYQVLSLLVGRVDTLNAARLTVRARREPSGSEELVRIFDVPDNVVTVSVQAFGDTAPELLPFDDDGGVDLRRRRGGSGSGGGGGGQDGERTVTLNRTKGRDIARIELLNGAGVPIRLGPRLVRLPV
jgi:hypothetical protein